MKKTVSIFIIAVSVLLLCAPVRADEGGIGAASSAAAPAEPGIRFADVYSGMQSDLGDPLYTFKGPAQVQIFQDVVDSAEKLPGIADIGPSDYTAVLHYEYNDIKLYIWASENSASFMYDNDIGALYKAEPGCAAKLYELLHSGGAPDDSYLLETENDIVSVKVFEAGYNGASLYTFTEPSDTLLFYSAMKHSIKLEVKVSKTPPDYRLDITDSSGSREAILWLGKADALLQYRVDPSIMYRVRDDDFKKLRALFDEYIAPIEEIEDLRHTSDIDLILKYPAPDMAVEPLEEGFGCWSAGSRGALDALLSCAGGKAEFILPSNGNLALEKAVLYDCSHISVSYRDDLTGNAVFYSAVNGNLDVYPWETGWKEAEINGYRCYTLTLERPGAKATLVYLQYKGWTIIEQIIGDAGIADVERCHNLEIYTWNDDMPALEQGGLLIRGSENINKALEAADGIAFEQHHNSYYECVRTSNVENLGRFLSERFGFSEYYYYDGSEGDLPLDRVNVEYDGERVTFLPGDAEGDEYKNFSFITGGCPSLPGEVNITVLPEDIIDFGSVTLGGVTYYYDVTKNYDKYTAHIEWEENGVRFSVNTRSSKIQAVDAGVISEWASHVKRVPLV